MKKIITFVAITGITALSLFLSSVELEDIDNANKNFNLSLSNTEIKGEYYDFGETRISTDDTVEIALQGLQISYTSTTVSIYSCIEDDGSGSWTFYSLEDETQSGSWGYVDCTLSTSSGVKYGTSVTTTQTYDIQVLTENTDTTVFQRLTYDSATCSSSYSNITSTAVCLHLKDRYDSGETHYNTVPVYRVNNGSWQQFSTGDTDYSVNSTSGVQNVIYQLNQVELTVDQETTSLKFNSITYPYGFISNQQFEVVFSIAEYDYLVIHELYLNSTEQVQFNLTEDELTIYISLDTIDSTFSIRNFHFVLNNTSITVHDISIDLENLGYYQVEESVTIIDNIKFDREIAYYEEEYFLFIDITVSDINYIPKEIGIQSLSPTGEYTFYAYQIENSMIELDESSYQIQIQFINTEHLYGDISHVVDYILMDNTDSSINTFDYIDLTGTDNIYTIPCVETFTDKLTYNTFELTENIIYTDDKLQLIIIFDNYTELGITLNSITIDEYVYTYSAFVLEDNTLTLQLNSSNVIGIHNIQIQSMNFTKYYDEDNSQTSNMTIAQNLEYSVINAVNLDNFVTGDISTNKYYYLNNEVVQVNLQLFNVSEYSLNSFTLSTFNSSNIQTSFIISEENILTFNIALANFSDGLNTIIITDFVFSKIHNNNINTNTSNISATIDFDVTSNNWSNGTYVSLMKFDSTETYVDKEVDISFNLLYPEYSTVVSVIVNGVSYNYSELEKNNNNYVVTISYDKSQIVNSINIIVNLEYKIYSTSREYIEENNSLIVYSDEYVSKAVIHNNYGLDKTKVYVNDSVNYSFIYTNLDKAELKYLTVNDIRYSINDELISVEYLDDNQVRVSINYTYSTPEIVTISLNSIEFDFIVDNELYKITKDLDKVTVFEVYDELTYALDEMNSTELNVIENFFVNKFVPVTNDNKIVRTTLYVVPTLVLGVALILLGKKFIYKT